MNMNDFGIVATTDHPLYKKLKSLGTNVVVIDRKNFILEEIKEHSPNYWLDFSLLSQGEKESLINELNGLVISDLTFNDGLEIHQRYEKVIASFSSGIPLPMNTIEFYINDINTEAMLSEIFENKLQIKIFHVSNPGIGFHIPRIMSMIANEAFFALTDQLASEQDIDNAMKFGVNYPIGPLTWAKTCGLEKVSWLLHSLYQKTKDERYTLAPQLSIFNN